MIGLHSQGLEEDNWGLYELHKPIMENGDCFLFFLQIIPCLQNFMKIRWPLIHRNILFIFI